MKNKIYEINIDSYEVGVVAKALSVMPYREVAGVIKKIEMQIQHQDQEELKKAEEAKKKPKKG